MSTAISIFQGRFGRIALLDVDERLIVHAHHHCHVLMNVSGADTYFLVRDKLQPLTRKTAVLVNAWEPHSYQHHSSESGRTVVLAMYIEPNWLAQFERQLLVSGHPLFFPAPCVEISADTRKRADDLATEMLVGEDVSAERRESDLFALMISVFDQSSQWRNFGELMRVNRSQTSDPRIRRAIALMRDNVGAGMDLTEVAARSGLSRAHFFELFRRSTNLTPNVYTNVLRMDAAIDSLTHSETSIADITYNIGFSAPGHFTRFFRDNLGITPSEYRKVVDVLDRRIEIPAPSFAGVASNPWSPRNRLSDARVISPTGG